jgi:hypothetical protein
MDRLDGIIRIGIVLAMLAAVLVGGGCKSLVESTSEKNINLSAALYGFKFQASDPAAQGAPTGKLGFGTLDYHSFPVQRGQPFYARRTVSSIWSSKAASETEIWVGRAHKDGELAFDSVPATMVVIGGPDWLRLGGTRVDVK